jgi:hypothetical protein
MGGARVASRVSHPGPGSRDQGLPSPAWCVKDRRGRVPQQPAWSLGGKQELGATISSVSSLALSGPAIHERTGSPAPKRYLRRGRVSACPREELPAGLSRCASGQGVGSAPGCGDAPAPSPENATAARRAGREGLKRVNPEGPVGSGGQGGRN